MREIRVRLQFMGGVAALSLIVSGCTTSTSNVEPVVAAEEVALPAPVQSDQTVGIEENNICGMAEDEASEKKITILQASGGIETRCVPGTKIADNASICLKELEKVTILRKSDTRSLEGPGCFYVATGNRDAATAARLSKFINSRGSSRARTGAIRGERGIRRMPATKAVRRTVDLGEVVVIRGSESALKRYKLKATILTGTKICLKPKESLTVLRKKGGVLNLKGPGCNIFRRSGKVENVAGVSAGD
ncbi:hypothetical protein [Parasphingorhabdus sp.]|uniref:hypothetical protein n=1 Tax=Parasphingorhabdus sp. TaxID=2709688 RepID=UPI003299A754